MRKSNGIRATFTISISRHIYFRYHAVYFDILLLNLLKSLNKLVAAFTSACCFASQFLSREYDQTSFAYFKTVSNNDFVWHPSDILKKALWSIWGKEKSIRFLIKLFFKLFHLIYVFESAMLSISKTKISIWYWELRVGVSVVLLLRSFSVVNIEVASKSEKGELTIHNACCLCLSQLHEGVTVRH